MKKEISCSNTFLPYVSDKTKKNGKIFVYYLNMSIFASNLILLPKK